MRIWSMIAVSSALLLSAGAATAQTLISVPDFGAPDIYGRGKNTSVLERERPDYQALGVHNGGFTIYPRLLVSAETNSNIYALPNNAPAPLHKVGDSMVIIEPSVIAQSNWGRHSLVLRAKLDEALFNHYKTEDTTAWSVSASGRLDVHGSSFVNVGADVDHQFEARGSQVSVINTLHPVSYNTQGAYIRGLYAQDRFRGALDLNYRAYEYQNQDDTSGVLVAEDQRDFSDSSIGGRLDYALTPDEAVFGKFTYSDTRYVHGTMNAALPAGAFTDKRNSSTTNTVIGGNFDITGLARGEIGVGYVDRKYESVNFKEVSGVSVAAKVEYFPTQLLTLTLVGQRQVNDSSFSTTGGYFQNTISAEADYELHRNIIISGAGGYERDQFPGLNRTDTVWNGQLQGRYFLTREVGLGAKLSYVKRDSNLPYPQAPRYDETRFALSLVFQR